MWVPIFQPAFIDMAGLENKLFSKSSLNSIRATIHFGAIITPLVVLRVQCLSATMGYEPRNMNNINCYS
jgi:hypothetical protein